MSGVFYLTQLLKLRETQLWPIVTKCDTIERLYAAMKGARTSTESSGKKKTREIEPPVCLGDLFAENNENNGRDEGAEEAAFTQLYEEQELEIGGKIFRIRQFAWHGANANKVWPGTFNLGEYIHLNKGN